MKPTLKNFIKDERGNATLWLMYIMFATLITTTWIIVFEIIQTNIFPLAVASGADTTRTYGYMVMFFKWFPLLLILGTSMYAVINSQKPERGY